MPMRKQAKGSYGYILQGRRFGLIRSALFLLLTLSLFFAGLMIFHTNRNALTILSALSCIPTGLSIVNLIMFYRAKPCPADLQTEIEAVRGGLLILYDLLMTSEQGNYMVYAVTVLDRNICGIVPEGSVRSDIIETHIRRQIALSNHHDYTIRMFTRREDFLTRLRQLETLRQGKGIDPYAIEEAWQPGTTQTVAGVLKSISL